MNLSSVSRTVTLLSRLFDFHSSTLAAIQTPLQRPALVRGAVKDAFPRAIPESMGVSSAVIQQFLKRLQEDPTLNMHSVLLIKDGAVLCSAGFGMQDLQVPKTTFSACKSVTSLAVGMLVDDGKLSVQDKVIDFFPTVVNPIIRLKLLNLTVENLLTMTSTVVFNEAESATEPDWVKGFLNSALLGEMGKTFSYNSLNTYMLAAIVSKVSGESLTSFLQKRLFTPLQITDVYWETCPKGIEKGGWGLYIRPEDFAKIGQLVLDDGVWKGKQLISRAYLQSATRMHCVAPKSYGDFNYGYQIWCGRNDDDDCFLFNGMFGQNVLCFRKSRILLVSNAGNSELFQQSNYFRYAIKTFGGSFAKALPQNPAQYRQLQAYVQGLRIPTPAQISPAQHFLRQMLGKAGLCPQARLQGLYLRADSADACAVGLMPVIWQAVENNFTRGLTGIAFSYENDVLFADYREADESHRFAVGFGCARQTVLRFHGCPLRVAAVGKLAKNEDGCTVLKIRVDFLETPCTRLIKLVFTGEGFSRAVLQQSELPGEAFVAQNVTGVIDTISKKPVLSTLVSVVDDDFLAYKVQKTFSPSIPMLASSLTEKCAVCRK